MEVALLAAFHLLLRDSLNMFSRLSVLRLLQFPDIPRRHALTMLNR